MRKRHSRVCFAPELSRLELQIESNTKYALEVIEFASGEHLFKATPVSLIRGRLFGGILRKRTKKYLEEVGAPVLVSKDLEGLAEKARIIINGHQDDLVLEFLHRPFEADYYVGRIRAA